MVVFSDRGGWILLPPLLDFLVGILFFSTDRIHGSGTPIPQLLIHATMGPLADINVASRSLVQGPVFEKASSDQVSRGLLVA